MRIIAIFLISLFVQTVCSQNTHVIQRGETFESIARKHGISVQELKTANPEDDECYTGLKITIPPKKVVIREEKTRSSRTRNRPVSRSTSKNRTRSSSSAWNMSNPYYMMEGGMGYGFFPIQTIPFNFNFDFNTGPEYKFDFSNMSVPTPILPDASSESPSSLNAEGEAQSSGSHQCRLCGGTGMKIKEDWMGGSETKWCNTCNKNVYITHSHVRCDACGGRGKW